jgi:hypothetical protein
MPLRGTNFRGPLIADRPPQIEAAATSHRFAVALLHARARAYDIVIVCAVPGL